MDDVRQFRAIVRGRVQGVGYRAATIEEGQALGLAGFARNLADGSVEVVARGSEADLRMLITFLHRGPTLANVDAVDVDWSDRTDAPRPFTLRR